MPMATKRVAPVALMRPMSIMHQPVVAGPMMLQNNFRSFNAAAATKAKKTMDTTSESNDGPIAIKVTTNKTYSEMDLLDEKLERVSESRTPVCFYPRAHKP